VVIFCSPPVERGKERKSGGTRFAGSIKKGKKKKEISFLFLRREGGGGGGNTKASMHGPGKGGTNNPRDYIPFFLHARGKRGGRFSDEKAIEEGGKNRDRYFQAYFCFRDEREEITGVSLHREKKGGGVVPTGLPNSWEGEKGLRSARKGEGRGRIDRISGF